MLSLPDVMPRPLSRRHLFADHLAMATAPDADVLVGHRGPVAVVTLNRPERLNAWTMDMQARAAALLEDLAADQEVPAVVLTGAGDRAFCAGQDLAETAAFTPPDVDRWLRSLRRLYAAVLNFDKPVVAAVNGVAAGSGYQVSLLCDVRVIHPGVTMGQTEVSSGIPSITGLYLTERALGRSRALEMMLTGRLLEAGELCQVGLAHHLVPAAEVVDRAVAMAERLARQPTVAVQATKQRAREQLAPGLWEAFEAAAEYDRRAWASGQPQQTMREFFEARGGPS
jgi:enoyl-CoA hydratase/carnithine racemase